MRSKARLLFAYAISIFFLPYADRSLKSVEGYKDNPTYSTAGEAASREHGLGCVSWGGNNGLCQGGESADDEDGELHLDDGREMVERLKSEGWLRFEGQVMDDCVDGGKEKERRGFELSFIYTRNDNRYSLGVRRREADSFKTCK